MRFLNFYKTFTGMLCEFDKLCYNAQELYPD